MFTINRTAIVVRPRQAFLDWLQQVDPTSGELTLEDLQRDPTLYLLPECDTDQEARESLEEVCGRIFEEQLEGWYQVPSQWPERRDMEVFDRWFEWSVHSTVIDLATDPLLREEL